MKNLLINKIISLLLFQQDYVNSLKHPITCQINHQTIPNIFRVLYCYGRPSMTEVQNKLNELLATQVNLDLPLRIMFREIEDFNTYAQAAGIPKSSKEIMDITLTMLKNCETCLTLAIIEWNRRPTAEKTWANMLTHFETAQQQLEAATDLPIGGQTSLHRP